MTQSMFFDVVARDKASATFSRIARASEATENRLKRFGRTTSGALGFTSLTVAATAFVKVGASYVGSLNKIQALSGLTDSQLSKVSKTLEGQSAVFAKMGQTTGDAANGMVELVKAGMSVSSAMKAVNATMVLAKAGELSVADASSLVANTLNTFHLKAQRAGDIANYLANAANISSADVSDLAESFKYVAPVAAATGVSLAQTNAILAELSNSGIAASNAGTGFRKFLLSLQAPSGAAKKDLHALGVEIFDSKGKMKPLGDVIDVLGKKLLGLSDQKRQKALKDIFGLQGVSSAQVILEHGKKGLEEYTKGVVKAGAAQRLANANSKGFAGTLSTLRAEVISTAQAGYRQLSPSLDQVAKKLVVFVDQMKSGKGAGGDVVEVLKALGAVAKTAAQFIGSIPGPVKKVGVEVLIAYYAMNKLSGAFGGLSARVAPSIASVKQFRAELSYTETRTGALSRVTSGLGSALTNVAGAGGMALLADGATKANTNMGRLETTLGAMAAGFAVGGPVGLGIATAVTGFYELKDAIAGTGDVKMPTPKQLGITDIIAGLDEATGKAGHFSKLSIFNFLSGKTKGAPPKGMAVGTTIRDTAKLYGIPTREVISAMTGNVKALENIRKRLNAAVKSGKPFAETDRDLLLSSINTAVKGYRAEQRAIQNQTAATKDYGNALRGLPKSLTTKIEQNGMRPALSSVESLTRSYKLTPAQVETVLKAAGVPATKQNIQSVIDKAIAFDKLRPKPKLDVDTSSAKHKLSALIAQLNTFLGKSDHVSGSLFPPGYNGGRRSGSGSKTTPRTSTGGSWTGTRNWEGSGTGTSSGTSPRALARSGRTAGTSYMTGLLDGIAGKQRSLGAALDQVRDRVQQATDKIKNLKSIKSAMKSTFQADSIFGADMETSGSSLGSLLQFQNDQKAKAQQLLADVKRVQSLRLSGSLLKQLQSQGESGAQILHLLAGADKGTIAQFNSSNAATQQALQAAGLSLGNDIRGKNIDTQIKLARRQEQKLEDIYRALAHLGKHQEWVVQLTPGGLVKIIRKEAKTAGKTPTQYLNSGN